MTTALLIVLTACETPSVKNRPGDGTVIIQMGRIGVDKVQYRHLDSVNAVRQARGLSNLSLNASLIRALLGIPGVIRSSLYGVRQKGRKRNRLETLLPSSLLGSHLTNLLCILVRRQK